MSKADLRLRKLKMPMQHFEHDRRCSTLPYVNLFLLGVCAEIDVTRHLFKNKKPLNSRPLARAQVALNAAAAPERLHAATRREVFKSVFGSVLQM